MVIEALGERCGRQTYEREQSPIDGAADGALAGVPDPGHPHQWDMQGVEGIGHAAGPGDWSCQRGRGPGVDGKQQYGGEDNERERAIRQPRRCWRPKRRDQKRNGGEIG